MADIPLQPSSLVALSPAALHRLRDTAGTPALQEAGYAAGESVYASFARWLRGTSFVGYGVSAPAPRCPGGRPSCRFALSRTGRGRSRQTS